MLLSQAERIHWKPRCMTGKLLQSNVASSWHLWIEVLHRVCKADLLAINQKRQQYACKGFPY
jgi:hypothetical protein